MCQFTVAKAITDENGYFELTRDEYNFLRSQFATLEIEQEIGRGKYSKYQPFAFTEQGVAMLSSVLNSKTAIAININIVRAFVAVRQLVLNPPVNEVKEWPSSKTLCLEKKLTRKF